MDDTRTERHRNASAQGSDEECIARTHRAAATMRGAYIVGSVLWTVMTIVITLETSFKGSGNTLVVPAAAMSLAAVAFGFFLPGLVRIGPRVSALPAGVQSMDRPNVRRAAQRLLTRSMVQGNMFMAPGLIGLILAFSGAQMAYYAAFFAVSLIALGLTFPSRAAWDAEIADATRSGGAPLGIS